MEKTFNIVVTEVKEQLLQVLNGNKIPIVVSQMIIAELLQSINIQANQILAIEKKEYEESLKEEKEVI